MTIESGPRLKTPVDIRRQAWQDFMDSHDPPTEQQWSKFLSHQHIIEVPPYPHGMRLRTEGAREYEAATNPGHSG